MTDLLTQPVVIQLAEIGDHQGTRLGPTAWRAITQDQVDRFAELTGDHNWIHVDTERAAAGPFGSTIAHGYLTLSMVVPFLDELLMIEGASMGVNYGLDRVRFPAPVPVNSRIRVSAEIKDVQEVAGGGTQFVIDTLFEVEGSPKPAVVAALVVRYYS